MKKPNSDGDFSAQRRSFLALASSALAGAAFAGGYAEGQEAGGDAASDVDRKKLRTLLESLLVTESAEMMDFAVEVYATCLLGKIRPADAPLMHPFVVPGGGYFAQWLWDTMFVVDLLAILPDERETIRGAFQNYWDFQKRWNAVMPAVRHGMVANFMAPFSAKGPRDGRDWKTFPAYSQAPLLAWGMERVYLRNGDKQMLRDGLGGIEEFHEWYWRERDVTNVGMVGVGAYSGVTQEARFETYDHEVDLDGLKMTAHPGRPEGPQNGPWYGDILIPANTAYLLLSEMCLRRMALVLGDHAMAKRREVRYAKGAAAVRDHMWSEKHGCFLAVQRDTLAQIEAPTVGGFMPLMAHIPSAAQAARMASVLSSPAWATPLPIPTVARTDANYVSSEFWRGDVWPAPNYQVATGLALYGEKKVAQEIADLTIANALKAGISERYDSVSGKALGVGGLGMSATILTMSLDGLASSRYRVRTRTAKS